MSGNTENNAAALPTGPALAEPESAIAKVSAQARQAGTDALEHAGKVVDDSVARAQEAIDQSVAAQKTVLDFSTRQTRAAFETAKKQFGYAGTPAATAADSLQHGFEVVVDAQKELLDVLKEPLKSVH